MTDDKNFKRLVRARARRAGVGYTEARAQLRPQEHPQQSAVGHQAVASEFDGLVEAVGSHLISDEGLRRLVMVGVISGMPLLFTDPPGTGQTALAEGVAAALNTDLVAVDGDPELASDDVPAVAEGVLLLVNYIDHIHPRVQRGLLDTAARGAILLAKRHPVTARVPFPLTDHLLDRFGISLSLGHPSPEVERAILSGDRPHRRRSAPTIGVGVDGIRTAAETVGFRDAVSQQVVMILQRIRDDPAVTGGLGVTAGLALRRLAQVAAAGAGRTDVEMEDIDLLLAPVLEHRLVVREGETPRQVLARATAEVV